MPISAEKILELASRPESSHLDFKVQHYDWANHGNLELAKDLMATGNSLGPTSQPGYLLIGVDNDGKLIGVPPGAHPDDASLHQKVSGVLNRTPAFTYGAVDVQGLSIGVFEVKPGGRPFYPLRENAKLKKFVPLYRNGSATEVASPDLVVEWAKEDDQASLRIQEITLRKLEAEVAVRARLLVTSKTLDGNGVTAALAIENQGLSDFFIGSLSCNVRWNDRFDEQARKHGVDAASVPVLVQYPLRPEVVRPGQRVSMPFKLPRALGMSLMQQGGVAIPGFSAEWADYELTLECTGILGGVGTATAIIR